MAVDAMQRYRRVEGGAALDLLLGLLTHCNLQGIEGELIDWTVWIQSYNSVHDSRSTEFAGN